MNANGWLQLLLYVGVLGALTKPIGAYLVRVLDPRGETWLDPVIGPIERGTYRWLGVDRESEQDWRAYGASMLAFSVVSLVFTYAVLRLQAWLPLNPQGFGAMGPDLAFNTAVSFATNTNWQSYGGESTLTYF